MDWSAIWNFLTIVDWEAVATLGAVIVALYLGVFKERKQRKDRHKQYVKLFNKELSSSKRVLEKAL